MIWLIGAGSMAESYISVLKDINKEFLVITRSEQSALKISDKFSLLCKTGGLRNFLNSKPSLPSAVIVAVGVEQLFECTKELLNYGIANILVEKPAGLKTEELDELIKIQQKTNSRVWVAYNRRYYRSTQIAKEMIAEDGGVISFNFEFTEWAHVIEKLAKPEIVLQNWLLANSTHVIDLAFHLGGKPKTMTSFSTGHDKLAWHKTACRFSGAGISVKDALFNYQATWDGPGRWGLEIVTNNRRLILRPMEELLVQKIGTVAQEKIELDTIDKSYKPGLYHQVLDFLNNKKDSACTLDEHSEFFPFYLQILNGNLKR